MAPSALPSDPPFPPLAFWLVDEVRTCFLDRVVGPADGILLDPVGTGRCSGLEEFWVPEGLRDDRLWLEGVEEENLRGALRFLVRGDMVCGLKVRTKDAESRVRSRIRGLFLLVG